MEDIEIIFKSELKQFLLSKKDIERYYESSQTGVRDKKRELDVVKEKVDKLKTKISKLFELHENNQIETERFKEFYSEPNEQLKQLEQTIPTLESEITILQEHAKSSELIIDEAQSLYDNWDNLSKEGKRSVVETITKDIIVGDDTVHINLYSISPPKKNSSFLELTSNGQHGLYSRLPICSYTQKAKIPKKTQSITKPTTLGEHIRKVRLERNQAQGFVAKTLKINQMYLSSWELNQKLPHPKHLKNIIDYLGYLPKKISKNELLGMQTKYFRMKYHLSLEEFCQMTNINSDVVVSLENKRFCKVSDMERKAILKSLKEIYKELSSFKN
jgi:DNA-binding transcriptional regulator YiaG